MVLQVQAHANVHSSAYYGAVNVTTSAGLNAAGAPGVNASLELIKATLAAKGSYP
jgi:hypothetical protein